MRPRNPSLHAADGSRLAEGSLPDTLRRVLEGLRDLRTAVRISGFGEALAGYRELRTVLLNQRMLSAQAGRTDLDRRWEEIGQTAREVAEILDPFARVMTDIGRLTDVQPVLSSREGGPGSEFARAILNRLTDAPIALSQLRRQFAAEPDAFNEALEELRSAGEVTVARHGRGTRISRAAPRAPTPP